MKIGVVWAISAFSCHFDIDLCATFEVKAHCYLLVKAKAGPSSSGLLVNNLDDYDVVCK